MLILIPRINNKSQVKIMRIPIGLETFRSHHRQKSNRKRKEIPISICLICDEIVIDCILYIILLYLTEANAKIIKFNNRWIISIAF